MCNSKLEHDSKDKILMTAMKSQNSDEPWKMLKPVYVSRDARRSRRNFPTKASALSSINIVQRLVPRLFTVTSYIDPELCPGATQEDMLCSVPTLSPHLAMSWNGPCLPTIYLLSVVLDSVPQRRVWIFAATAGPSISCANVIIWVII